MKKIIAIVMLSTSAIASTAFAEDRVLATYKGGDVKESQIMEQLKPAMEAQPTLKGKSFGEFDKNVQEALVRGFVNFKLLEQEAKDQKIESTKEFQDKVENFKKQLLQQEVIDRRIKATLNEKMVDDEYQKLAANLKGKEEIKVSHILLDTKEKANNVKTKLNKGGKFNALAKEFSKDTETKARGGELGYVMQGQLVPEFETKAFSMKVNEVSDPVQTQFGWHIIKVLDKRPATVPTKEEAKQNITAKVTREIVEQYFTELNKKADVKFNLPKAEESKKEEAKKVEENKK